MSGSKIVLDTNIILYLLAGDETLSLFLQDKEGYISVITEMELIGFPDISAKELQKDKRFLSDCTIVDLTEQVKEIYVEVRKKYKLKLGDACVAATAIYLDLSCISADKGFTKVTELQLTQYNQ